jgi:hypothetical protein
MKKGKVVFVDPPRHRIYRGQPVFVLVETAGARWGRIQSIQLDGAAADAIEPGTAAANGIGIKLDFKCPKATDLVAMAHEDDVVWSPREEANVPAA